MISIPIDPALVWLLVFLRVGLIITFFPLFGEDFVPIRVRILLSMLVAFVLTPVVPFHADLFPKTVFGMGAMVASEAMLAFGIGLTGKALFGVIQFAGQVGGEQMGFGTVNSVDPTSQIQVAVVAEMQYLLALMVFLTAGMHHMMLSVMAESFAILRPGSAVLTAGVGEYFLHLGAAVFSLSLKFAMPVILIVFIINIALAMIGRAAPQLNVFLESFPLRILGGMAVLMGGLPLMVRLWMQMFEGMQSSLGHLLFNMKG